MKTLLSISLLSLILTSCGGGRGEVSKLVSGKSTEAVSEDLCFKAINGDGEPVYYDDAQTKIMVERSGIVGERWYYPDGSVMSDYAGSQGAAWYHPNGQVLTTYAGKADEPWWHSNGILMSSKAGGGRPWYDSTGTVMLLEGPQLSAQDLLYPICVTEEI